jgi:hypothetical protein
MSSLIEEFKEMRRRGLIAKREVYCEHCSPGMMLKAAHRGRDKHRDIRGFVHLGEWEPVTNLTDARVPVVFGSVTGDAVAYNEAECIAIGEVVADCLKEEGIPYEWDEVLGSPILVKVDHSISGLPSAGHQHESPLGEDHSAFRSPRLPDSVFDKIGENPVRLLNLAKLRRVKLDAPHQRGRVLRPRVGDSVKLGFLVWDAVAPQAREECGDMIDRLQLEAMWVEVTSILKKSPECVYRGELVNRPFFIDPAKLRIGSPVEFTAEHVYPVEKPSKKGVRR